MRGRVEEPPVGLARLGGLALVALIVLGAATRGSVQERVPSSAYLYSKGSWGQSYADQWAHWKVGLRPKGQQSAWDIEDGERNPVVVAFIDTGLDYVHPGIARRNIWVNLKEVPGNGVDDDKNGFVDDVIGWNFIDNDNDPWDNDGHGTFTAGIVAATVDDAEGIAGINRGVRIMALKALDFQGRASVSQVIPAIVYAADNGARIVNVSIEQMEAERSGALQWAVDYAYQKGVLVVVAAGNQGRDTALNSPSGLDHVITVAGTDTEDKRLGFSNYGKYVRIAAPGEEILSLRARRTDLLVMAGSKQYTPGQAFVGAEAKYYHATGTSFAAPFVAGVASLILAKNPRLTPVQVEHMLLMSADDVETPGWDQLTGYGRLNARKALEADPDYYLYSEIHRVLPTRDQGRSVIQVLGRVTGSRLDRYEIQLGRGEDPTSWKTVIMERGRPVDDGVLGAIPGREITALGHWTVRLLAYDTNGQVRESRGRLNVQ